MFRGLRRLFRFRLRVSNLHVGGTTLYADWNIIDVKEHRTVARLIGCERRQAKKALRLYRKYGD